MKKLSVAVFQELRVDSSEGSCIAEPSVLVAALSVDEVEKSLYDSLMVKKYKKYE